MTGSIPTDAEREQNERQAEEQRDGGPDYAADWPRKGGFGDAAQPWDLERQGFKVGTADDGSATITNTANGKFVNLAPGERDPVSPIVPGHGRPPLASLSAGPAVQELGELLAELGYPTSVSRGQNPLGVFDESVAAAVERFRDDYDVREDPSQFARGDRRAAAESHVLAWTWEGLLRAAARAREERADDRRALTFA